MTSPTTIKRLRELLEKAPAGPWERDGDGLIAPADATAVGSPWVAVAVHHACLPLLEEVSRHLPALLDRVEAMEKALKPFADEAESWAEMWGDDYVPVLTPAECCDECGHANVDPERPKFNIGDLRRARIVSEQSQ